MKVTYTYEAHGTVKTATFWGKSLDAVLETADRALKLFGGNLINFHMH